MTLANEIMWVFTSCYQVSVFSPSHRPEKTGICKEERWQFGTNYAERCMLDMMNYLRPLA